MPIPERRPKRQPAQLHRIDSEARSASIDWITCTAKRKGSGEALWALGDTLLRENASEGNNARPWQMKGYRGWAAGSVRLGARHDSVILVLSGKESRDQWRQCWAASENCSRLDLAVDVYCDPINVDVAVDVYRQMGHAPSRSGRPSKYALIRSSDGGSTAYIGSRVSECFMRVYDKGVEQQAACAGSWWRVELELKGERAKSVACSLQQTVAEAQQITSVTLSFLQSRAGVVIPYNDVAELGKLLPRPPDVDRQLLWLSRSVRPTLQALMVARGRATVLRALGLLQSEREDHERSLTSEEVHHAPNWAAVSGHCRHDVARADSGERLDVPRAYGHQH